MMLQQLVASSMTMVDNLMIGSLGDNALAALMQASQVTFVFLIFIFGITSATTALTSQFWGSQDLPSIRRTFGLSLICGQVIGWVFCILCAITPQTFLLLFTNDPEVLALGAQYLSIVCFPYRSRLYIGRHYARYGRCKIPHGNSLDRPCRQRGF